MMKSNVMLIHKLVIAAFAIQEPREVEIMRI
jgi:hypothetical protein